MRRRSWTPTGRRAVTGALVLVFVLAVSQAAFAAKPTPPNFKDAYPSGSNRVTLTWLASVDPSPTHTVSYELYRSKVPITQAMITPVLSPLVSIITPVSITSAESTWTAVVNADVANGEVSDAYVWYYAIRGKDDQVTPEYSDPSATLAPNMHGYNMSLNVYSCQRCHNVHGAPTPPGIINRSSWMCYYCHGTDSTTNSGNNGDSFGTIGDRSTLHTKAEFYDYDNLPVGGSQHRSAKMTAVNQQCRACHTPHRASYYFTTPDGSTIAYDPLQSFRRMLRVQTGVDGAGKATYTNGYYSRNDNTAENTSFCFSCHGSTTASPTDGSAETNMGYVSDGGYATTAGDHNETGYATAAHGPGVIYSNDYVPGNATADDDLPQVQCLACHNKHASAADKLIAYRGDDTNGASTYAQAELCYACHSAASAETRVAAGNSAPYSWNGRDVRAQFQKASHHPTSVPTGGPVAQPCAWTQTTQAELQTGVLSDTIATPAGSIELEPIYAAATALSEGFEDGTWTTDFPTSVGEWEQNTTWSPELTYSMRGGNGTTTPDLLTSRVMSLDGWTNVTVSFEWQNAAMDTGEYMRVQYSTDGTNYTDGWSSQGNGGTATGTNNFTISTPTSTTYIRLRVEGADAGEYGYWDDISVTGYQPGGYLANGTAVSAAVSPAGALEFWGTLTYSATQPAGTSLTVDVLDASNDSPLIIGASSGADLSGLAAMSLKLRANLIGDSPATDAVADNFDDNSFDTNKWADVFLNSTDPDTPAAQDVLNEGFEDGTWTTDFPTSVGEWEQNTTWSPELTHSMRGGNGATTPDLLTSRVMSLGGWTNVSVSFQWQRVAIDTGEYMRVQYSNDGVNYTDGWSSQGTGATVAGTNSFTIPAPTSTTYIRLRVEGADAGEYGYWDDISITGTPPATALWPLEANQQLTLRAEGAGFTGTADQGEFTYIDPANATWISGADFDVRVWLGAVRSNTPQAGLMIRTGTTEANASATNAPFVGLWPTGGTSADFRYRANAGGTAATNGSSATTLPRWLRVTRTGNVFAAYISGDGSTWVRVGTDQSVPMSTVVLVGLATSSASATDGAFSEADFDNFSITEVLGATTTPALNDWTMTYTYFPAATSGYLTCANCHNVHYVAPGNTDETVAANWWNMSRASNPDDTSGSYSGTPTEFCLTCHDGSLPTTGGNSASILVPYAAAFSDKSAATFFPGWNKTQTGAEWASGGHRSTTIKELTGDIGCQTCHDPHASDNARLTAYTFDEAGANATHTGTVNRNNTTTYAEQDLCYACHGNTKSGTCGSAGCHATSIAFLNVQTPFATTYRHPVQTTGRHSDTETAAGLGLSNRHAECADCHDPHATRVGRHTTADSTAGEALRGAVGIKPVNGVWPANWTAVAVEDWASERMTGEDVDYEAYLCLKCHSSYSGQPFALTAAQGNGRAYTSTDVAMEFNPSNQSEHNVFGQRTVMETAFTVNGTPVTWSKPTDGTFLVAGWTSNSEMTCTDCHSNTATTAARGPHGSSTPWMIADGYTTWTDTSTFSSTSLICFKCHTNLANSNRAHQEHDTRGAEGGYCRFCHVKIPHGWKRPRLLGYTTDPAPYATIPGGLIEIELKSYTPGGWGTADCYAACDTGRHPDQSPAWP